MFADDVNMYVKIANDDCSHGAFATSTDFSHGLGPGMAAWIKPRYTAVCSQLHSSIIVS